MTELVDRAAWLGVPSVVVGELHLGFLGGRHRERNESELSEFLADPVVDEIPVDHDVALIYAEIVAALRSLGRPMPTNDAWIAATAARAGAPLLTFDEHFRAIGRVGTIVLQAVAR